MTDLDAYKPLKNRWTNLHIPKDGVAPVAEMYKGVDFRIGYDFQRLYRKVSMAAEYGPIIINFTPERTVVANEEEIFFEDDKFHARLSFDQKRHYIKTMLERDDLVASYITFIDKEDEMTLEVVAPD